MAGPGQARGWITTPALAPGGTGHDELAIKGSQIASATITETQLDSSIVAKLNLADVGLIEALEELLVEVTELRDLVSLVLG